MCVDACTVCAVYVVCTCAVCYIRTLTHLLSHWFHSEVFSVAKRWLRGARHCVCVCGLRIQVELEATVEVLYANQTRNRGSEVNM